MKKGVVELDGEGRPRCHICGKGFHRVMTHVRQAHRMSAKTYKKRFGLDRLRGICSVKSRAKSRKAVLARPELIRDLIKSGSGTRFAKGHPARSGMTLSLQERLRLREQAKSVSAVEARRELGRIVGRSGHNRSRGGGGGYG